MAEPKTRPTDVDVNQFLAAIPNAQRRADAVELAAMMTEVTEAQPVLWGTSIVGFGDSSSTAAGSTGAPWPLVSFAARKTELVLYLHPSLEADCFENLGPHRRGVGCLYVKSLQALDRDVLRRLIVRSISLTTG